MKQNFKQKLMAGLLSVCMMFQTVGTVPVYAAENVMDSGLSIGTSSVCTHHVHDEKCGYTEGTPCTHEHKVNGTAGDRENPLGDKDECSAEVTKCVHEHTAECYPVQDSGEATGSEAKEPTACTHICDEKSGCITKELACKHVHDDKCGYKEGKPCTFDPATCESCKAKDSNIMLLVDNPVASVTIGGTTTEYSTLDEAWGQLEGNTATLKLLNNVTNSSTRALNSGNATLDLNGYTWTEERQSERQAIIVKNSATILTVEDNSSTQMGKMVNNTAYKYALIAVMTGSTLNITGGSYSNPNGTILAGNMSTINVSGGNFSGKNSEGQAVSFNGGTGTFSGGIIETGSVYLRQSAVVELSGGTFCKLQSVGGTFTPKEGYAFRNTTGEKTWESYTTISIGQTKENLTVQKAPVSITKQPAYEGSLDEGYTKGPALSVTAEKTETAGAGDIIYEWYENGTPIANATTNSYQVPIGKVAGTYAYNCKLSIDGYEISSQAVTIVVQKQVEYVARITIGNVTTNCTTLQAAFDLCNTTQAATVTLLKNVTLEDGKFINIFNNISRNITFDLQNYKLQGKSEGNGILYGGTNNEYHVTIKGSGTLENTATNPKTANNAICLMNSKPEGIQEVVIQEQVKINANGGQSICVDSSKGRVIVNDQAAVTGSNTYKIQSFYAGVINAPEVHINGGVVTNNSDGFVICTPVANAGEVYVSGGSIQGTGTPIAAGKIYYAVTHDLDAGKGSISQWTEEATTTYDNMRYGKKGAVITFTVTPTDSYGITGVPTITTANGQSIAVTKTSTEAYGVAKQALTFSYTQPSSPVSVSVPLKSVYTITAVAGKNVKAYDKEAFTVTAEKDKFFTWNGTGTAATEGYYTKGTDGNYTKTTIEGSGAAAEGGAPVKAGTYYVKLNVSADNDYLATTAYMPITISQSGTTFDGGITVDKTDKTYTYGDTITVKATPKATGIAARSFTLPTANQMALFVGSTQITAPVNVGANGVYTMTYDTAGKDLKIGSNTITAKYVGNANMADYSGTVDVTLNKKAITSATVTAGVTKEYDRTGNYTGVALTPKASDILGGDAVTATADGTVADANVGETKAFKATGVTLGGKDAGYYSLAASAVSGNVTIVAIAPTVEGKFVFANGTPITIEAGTVDANKTKIKYNDGTNDVYLKLSGESTEADLSQWIIYGGAKDTSVESTSINMTGGTVGSVYGGGYTGTVTGSTTVTISGGTVINNVYGGGDSNAATVGSTKVEISGGTVTAVYGGGNETAATVTGGTAVTISGSAKVTTNVYGGGYTGTVTDGTAVTISGSATIGGAVYGGGKDTAATVTGGTAVTISDSAKVTTNIYGGGYTGTVTDGTAVTISGSATIGGGVFGGGSETAATVTGGTAVTISGSATVTLGVYGGGMKSKVDGGTTVIVSGDATLKGNGVFGKSTAEMTGTKTGYVALAGKADATTFDNLLYKDTATSWTVKGSCTLAENVILAANETLTVPSGATLTVPSGKTLTANGTLTGNGKLVNNGGTLNITAFQADDIQGISDKVYTGNVIAFTPTVAANRTILGNTFTIDASGYTSKYQKQNGDKSWADVTEIKDAGNYKIVYTKGSTTVEKPFAITKSGTTFDGGITVDKTDKTYTYGDTITVKATPKATGTAARLFTAPTANQMALFVGDKQITKPQTVTSGTELIFTIATKDKQLAVGSNIITAKYVGNANMADYSESVTVTLNKKAITSASVNAGATKVYDGTNSFTGVALTLNASGILSGDTVTATADGTAANANVGATKTFKANSVTLGGKDAGYYSLAASAVSGNVAITKAEITGVSQEYPVVKTLAKDYSFDLSKLLPSISSTQEYGNVTYAVASTSNANSVLTAVPTNSDIANDKLTLKVANVATKDQTATVTISITSDNFTVTNAVITVKTVDKIPLTISGVAMAERMYSGSVYAYTGTPAFTNTTDNTAVTGVSFTKEYQGRNGTSYTKSETAPTNAGEYNLILTVSGASASTYAGTLTVPFAITQKEVTVKAKDKDILVGAEIPSLANPALNTDYTVAGFIGNDTLTGTVSMSYTGAPDNTQHGSYPITISGGTASDNYTVKYENGTLTISIDVSLITAAITAADNAKGGIAIYDTAASSVANGTKFVTTAEMSTLNTAIQTATAAKATCTTLAQVQTAVKALNDAVADFKTAIKTGTYTAPSGGGSTGGGSDSGSVGTVTPPPTTTTPTNPNPPTTGEIKAPATVDKNGNASITVTDKTVADAIKKAQDEAKKNGTEKNGVSVELNVDTGKKTPNSISAKLPKAVQDSLVREKVDEFKVTSSLVDLTFDSKTLQEIQKQAGGDATIHASKADVSKLPKEAQKEIGNRPVFNLSITGKDGKAISDFGGGSVTVSIPYTLQEGENPNNLQAYFVDAKGKLHEVACTYDPVTKCMVFVTNHFSVYGIGYKENAPKFNDIETHWAKNDIEFVTARGLLSGTDKATFSPNTAMTRGMFVTALGRLAGADVSGYQKSSFTDIKATDYFMGYVEWASKNGIVKGTSATTFAPNAAISRQEMAVIMTNYAKTMNYTLPKTRTAVTFADNANIASWAAEAVKSMQMAGVIMGKDGNRFDPTATATRAEASAVLRRYVELVIDKATAQGLDVNDSGKIVYYENGKLFTGTKTIDGTTYHFGNDGICVKIDAVIPDTKKYVIHKIVRGDTLWDIAIKNKCTVAEIVGLNGIKNPNSVPIGTELKIPQK